jgi:hypothetical protein
MSDGFRDAQNRREARLAPCHHLAPFVACLRPEDLGELATQFWPRAPRELIGDRRRIERHPSSS